MSAQHQNNGNMGSNVPFNGGPATGFNLASLCAADFGPPHDPFSKWVNNTSRRDNPISDSQFKYDAVDNPTEKMKSTQKKSARKNSTGKRQSKNQPAQEKSTGEESKTK
ncbi:hypothetical protein V494_06813 [Pseudogymnoascus sp. VKM F-4513 (FW-928)]|nr:hypothetical protein V494_06813 [Pseudogymnoascus sp. VKM F-4513 (FW-928)]